MPLKPKNPQTHSESPPPKDERSGPWGRINTDSHAVAALRLCKKTSSSTEETYSYPYRVLSSWHWRSGLDGEELRIEAASDVIVVKGRGLDRLVESLDLNTLEILNEMPAHLLQGVENKVQIASILVTPS